MKNKREKVNNVLMFYYGVLYVTEVFTDLPL